ncbi:MAG TPA: M23 family metallopeptidase [Phycisphaerales bacterium]|nr:M23 family metallopeptidase [Phycisphaerales bacterium]HMP38659.1 M23 family metallopeptidase [Phycisphaerales bacterium]
MDRYTRASLARMLAPALIGVAAIAADAAALGSPPVGATVGAAEPIGARRGVVAAPCVTPGLAALVRRESDSNRVRLGLPSPPEQLPILDGGVASDAPPYRFYPMAGRHAVDIMNGGFVDLDPGPGAIDYACRPWTYGGHEGIDTEIRSFGEQFVGVPVFAARDGIVVFAQDGWPDTNIFGGIQGNIVVLDHGDGSESQYYHLKQGSVAVGVGTSVRAGTQIGSVGSSGNSFGPHLHFQTMRFVGGQWSVVEPFAGPCRPGASDWTDQAPLDTDALFLHDFGITRTDLSALAEPWWTPWPLPTDGQIQLDDPAVVFWWRVFNFPPNCPVRVRFYRPNGTLAWDAQWNWGNLETWRIHKNWFAFGLPAMGPTPGTWRLLFELDGTVMMDTPFEMVTTVDPAFNRPPLPVAASFAIAAPALDDVLFCNAVRSSPIEDPDWDIVRYRWRWTIDGVEVRDVVTAAQSDAIPLRIAVPGLGEIAMPGSVVTCSVTPSDGLLDGPTVSVSTTVAGAAAPGDLDGDGDVDGADLGVLLGSWGPCPGCPADLDGNGTVDGADLGALLGGWTG